MYEQDAQFVEKIISRIFVSRLRLATWKETDSEQTENHGRRRVSISAELSAILKGVTLAG